MKTNAITSTACYFPRCPTCGRSDPNLSALRTAERIPGVGNARAFSTRDQIRNPLSVRRQVCSPKALEFLKVLRRFGSKPRQRRAVLLRLGLLLGLD